MFADDTTLLAKSRHALREMLEDAIDELGKIGLNLNADNCKIQCTKQAKRQQKFVKEPS